MHKSQHLKADLYRDKNKEWRWKVLKKGRVIADSAEGYKKRIMCVEMLQMTLGLDQINWLTENKDFKYGQSYRDVAGDTDVVEVGIFKTWPEEKVEEVEGIKE